MRILLIVTLTQIAGCTISAGLAVHDNDFDSFKTSNPIGVVRGETTARLPFGAKGFCMHASGIPDKERGGYGLNMCGGMVRIW